MWSQEVQDSGTTLLGTEDPLSSGTTQGPCVHDFMSLRAFLSISALVVSACSRGEVADQGDSNQVDSVAVATIDSGAPKLLPRDEANESFREFRTQLLDALSRKDTTFLYGILDPVIKNSFGGDEGIDGFKRIWEMDSTAESRVWAALTRVLSMGGQQADDTIFVAPYVHVWWPDSIDAFEHVVVTGSSVKVHEQPLAEARVLGTVNHSILRIREWKNLSPDGVPADSIWANVQLPSGVQGWIQSRDVYSPVSWRAMFVRHGARWVMVFFVAGD